MSEHLQDHHECLPISGTQLEEDPLASAVHVAPSCSSPRASSIMGCAGCARLACGSLSALSRGAAARRVVLSCQLTFSGVLFPLAMAMPAALRVLTPFVTTSWKARSFQGGANTEEHSLLSAITTRTSRQRA